MGEKYHVEPDPLNQGKHRVFTREPNGRWGDLIQENMGFNAAHDLAERLNAEDKTND